MAAELKSEQYLKMAYQVATQSPDPSTQNGAVIVSTTGVVVSACNKFPTRVKSTPERLERPLKYEFIEHAERGAVYEAARLGVSAQGGTMYVPWFACSDCARAIICAGISRVVGHKKMADGTPERWKESIKNALIMLEESGVQTELYDGDIGGVTTLFNGAPFTP